MHVRWDNANALQLRRMWERRHNIKSKARPCPYKPLRVVVKSPKMIAKSKRETAETEGLSEICIRMYICSNMHAN